jgi:hypothetical protein
MEPEPENPATAWEAEIDRLMQAQASESNPDKRKRYFDRVQEIAWEQAPFLYLLNKNTLIAVSPSLHNVKAALIRPYVYWNAESLSLSTQVASQRPLVSLGGSLGGAANPGRSRLFRRPEPAESQPRAELPAPQWNVLAVRRIYGVCLFAPDLSCYN